MKYKLSIEVSSYFVVGFLVIVGFIIFSSPVYAISSISGSNSATSSVGVALSINDVQIVGNAASTTPIKLVVSNGTLGITNTGGLSGLSGTTGSTITFSGTVANINTALATLTYTRGGVGSDVLEISLVGAGEVFFPENGHLYEYISSVGDWNAARTAATALTRYDTTGYLTTITSADENDFVADRLLNAGWMGASDAALEADWRWVTGPETGTQFWSGGIGGTTVGGNYANWNSGEPNNSDAGEDCAQFLAGGSGEWNDLPCSSTTLPGYVAEFGAPGDMPVVVAKNIALATVAAPVVNSFVPADNASNVNGANNLVLTFSEAVTVGAGTISIFRTSDDSLVESIAVTGGQVTGGGTSVITVNPTSNLADATGYYLHIASTTFKNASDVFYLGITNSTSWNFTTGDFTAPTFSTIIATPYRDSVLITWNTNELSSSRVVYGVGAETNLTTTQTNTTPRVTSHSVTIPGLNACTTYSYRLVGIDSSSNAATSSIATFKTDGCSSGSGSTRVIPPAASPAARPASLQTLFNEKKLADAVALITHDTRYIANEPKLVVKVLQSYLTQLKSGITTTPTTGSTLGVRDLYRGLSGEDVRALQTLLINHNAGPKALELKRVTATGDFINYTEEALIEYQLKYDISPATGYFGPASRTQMKAVGLAGLWW